MKTRYEMYEFEFTGITTKDNITYENYDLSFADRDILIHRYSFNNNIWYRRRKNNNRTVTTYTELNIMLRNELIEKAKNIRLTYNDDIFKKLNQVCSSFHSDIFDLIVVQLNNLLPVHYLETAVEEIMV